MTLEEAMTRYPGAETFTFGDSRALCEALLALVRAGMKTATCGARREFGGGARHCRRRGEGTLRSNGTGRRRW